MSAIFEEITLSWEDKEVVVQPTFRMVQSIESKGISIFATYESIRLNEPRVTHVAEIVSSLLISGGARSATPEKVYQRICRAPQEEWTAIAAAILAVFMPKDTRSKNSEGPEESGADGTEM